MDSHRPSRDLAYCVVLLSAFLILSSSLAAAARPNIILLMGDDHGWEETGYNGHPHVHTPVLDEMAATGLRLDHFYSAHPSCSPTRGSVLTGRHPNRYGTFTPNWSIRPEEITIAHLLKEAGYRCGHFGKWHVGPVKADSPTNPGAMGFDEWLSHDNFFELNPSFSRNGGPPQVYPGESSEILIDQALKFIAQAQAAQQASLTVIWFGSPHEPYSGLEADLARYDSLPESYAKRTVSLTSNETGSRTRRPLRDVLRERYAEITAMDRAIGTLRKGLAARDLRENTLLWYCGDNGTPSSGVLASPFRGQKGQVYEGGVRVPCVIEWPQGLPTVQASAVKTVTSDILPTLCRLAGVPVPQRPLDGIDLAPLFEGSLSARKQPIYFWEYDTRREAELGFQPYIPATQQEGTTPLVKLMNGKPTRTFRNLHHPTITEGDYGGTRAIVAGPKKLILRDQKDGDTITELFDLHLDPSESRDHAKQEPGTARLLARDLRAWQASVLRSLTGADY